MRRMSNKPEKEKKYEETGELYKGDDVLIEVKSYDQLKMYIRVRRVSKPDSENRFDIVEIFDEDMKRIGEIVPHTVKLYYSTCDSWNVNEYSKLGWPFIKDEEE